MFLASPWASQLRLLGRLPVEFIGQVIEFIGRGSWIRTNDLQYPKLPRYQAALYPDYLGNDVDTPLGWCQQGIPTGSVPAEQRVGHPVARGYTVFLGGAGDHLEHALRKPPGGNDPGG